MNPKFRTAFFAVFGAIAFGALLYGVTGLPRFGSFSGAYSDYLLQAAPIERHIMNVATAVNFDYRGFDTLGEEFIFFTSVTGVLFMLGALHAKAEQHKEPMELPAMRAQTGAIRWFPMGLAAFLVAMAMNVAAHTTVTPGGGFQGGAVFGSAIACVYLGVGYAAFTAVAKREVLNSLKAFGAACYAFIGIATAFAAGAFLKNSLYVGQSGAIVSGGTVQLINAAVFIEIGCGFTVLLLVFLHQMRHIEEPD